MRGRPRLESSIFSWSQVSFRAWTSPVVAFSFLCPTLQTHVMVRPSTWTSGVNIVLVLFDCGSLSLRVNVELESPLTHRESLRSCLSEGERSKSLATPFLSQVSDQLVVELLHVRSCMHRQPCPDVAQAVS